MRRILLFIHYIIVFFVVALILSVQNEIAITKTFILFYVVIATVLLIPFVVSLGVWNKIYKHEDFYSFISTLPILLISLILIWQHWDIYGEIIKDFLS